MASTPFSWKNTPLPDELSVPGHDFAVSREKLWHRALWAMEPTCALCAYLQPGFLDIISSVQIHSTTRPLSISHIKQAVRSLRFRHPSVASRLAWPTESTPGHFPDPYSARLVYEATTDAGVEKWVDKVVVDRTAVMDQADGSLKNAVDLVLREVGKESSSPHTTLLNVYFVAASGSDAALVLRGSHALFDAVGLLTCMNWLVSEISQSLGAEDLISPRTLQWGDEVNRLVGSAVDYTKVLWSPEEDIQDRVRLQNVKHIIEEIKAPCGLPIPNPSAHASTTTIFVRSLSKETLDNILSTARSQGCTFFPVVFAALVLAMLRVSPPATREGLSVPSLANAVNLRHKDVLTGRDGEVLSGLGFNVMAARDLGRFVRDTPSPDDIWVLARELRAQLRDQQDQIPSVASWAHGFISGVMALATGGGNERKEPRVPDFVAPSMTSLGVVDKYLAVSHDIPSGGVLNVSDPIVSVCLSYVSPLLGPIVGLHSFTWHDTPYMCFSFPEAFMGSLQDQKRLLEERKHLTGTVLEWSEEFMKILESVGAV